MKKKLITVLLVSILSSSILACNEASNNTEDNVVSEENILSEESENSSADTTDIEIIVSNPLECPLFTAEKNSSAMVDQIALTAKDYATSLSDEQADEIISIIREADHNFYNGPEEMEKFMWYGYLLDYKYDDSDVRSSLGTDLYQAIKYVYRGVDSVLDDATHENLLQIDESLELLK